MKISINFKIDPAKIDSLEGQDDFVNPSIDWIAANMCPEDVFNDQQLGLWAKDNGFIEEES